MASGLRVPGADSAAMFDYLVEIKTTLGNLNNDISFVAALLVKPFLRQRFGVEFDAGLKAQGAPGICAEVGDGVKGYPDAARKERVQVVDRRGWLSF
jgi:hypothetical protein